MSSFGLVFRLVWYDTDKDNKYESEHRHEILGSKEDIFRFWFVLTHDLKHKHVEVYNLLGTKCDPSRGHAGLTGYSI